MYQRKFTSCISSAIILFFVSFTAHAQIQTPLDVAVKHYQEQKKKYDLTETDINNYRVSDNYTSRHNGVTHVYLQQEHDGIPVIQAISNFNIMPNGEILSMGSRFTSNLASKVNTNQPGIEPGSAIRSVINHFNVPADGKPVLERQINDREFVFKKDGIALEPVEVKLMYQPTEKEGVRLVWEVSLYERSAHNWWVASVDALTSEVIYHYNQVIHCDFGSPEDVCEEEGHFHPISSKATLEENPPMVIENAYNVFPMPIESPNHGSQSIVIDPADPEASPFGWHDTDGQPGHEYTITRGNNVHAYQDIFDQNGSIGDEPDGGDSLVFDYLFDVNSANPYTQVDAATVNLFYWCNLMHDVWYQYGFDEASGNFQVNNYGNGGAQGDWIRAEALDGSGTNNANYSGGADGSNARIQMYYWGGGNPPVAGNAELNVLEPDAVMGTYQMAQGGFGDPLPASPIVSQVVLVDDGVGTGSDACEAIINGDDIAGKIAMIDRGGDCQFGTKSLRAQNAGAIAVIICNHVPGDGIFSMGAGVDGGQVNIPAVMVSFEDCVTLKMGLADSLVVEMTGGQFDIPLPGPTGRDGDFDNGIIAHEYTHGISIRLTGGPNTGNCLTGFEQQGEGWSDWFGLVMQTTEDNTADQIRGIGTYATGQPTNGGGIRNFPYTRSMQLNPQTYTDISSTNVPHGVGEIWAAMIWDLYWNFIDIYGFDTDFYQGTGGNNMVMQLVLDGLKLQPCNPSFPEARDAIIAADEANYNGDHRCLIWETFARRGVGFSATAGGNEAFDMPPFCSPFLKVTKTAVPTIDAGGTITYTLTIRNDTPEDLATATIEDILPAEVTFVQGSSTCGGTVTGGVLTIDLIDFNSGDEMVCTYQMQTDPNTTLKVAFEDDVEGSTSIWSKTAQVGSSIWLPSGTNTNSGIKAWKAGNPGSPCDQLLTLKEPVLLSGENPALSFWHDYMTEANFDGGIVEISTDEGMTWEDLDPYMLYNGYNDQLANDPSNALAGQNAFTGTSNGYIQTVAELNAFKGESVIIRFRFACNEGNGAQGWFVDDIQLFDDLTVVINEVCLNSSIDDPVCSAAATIVLGDEVSTTEVLPESYVTLFPNPTTGQLHLNWDDQLSNVLSVKLSNIDGRVLGEWEVGDAASALSLDIAEFGKGLYLIQVLTEDAFVSKKVVVN